jgi:hypothetical protein
MNVMPNNSDNNSNNDNDHNNAKQFDNNNNFVKQCWVLLRGRLVALPT